MSETKFYECLKWPNLDIAVTPHPTKDRNGNIGELGHHISFKNGKLSTDKPEDIEFLETSDLFISGIVKIVDPEKEAEKAQELKDLGDRAKALGLKLVKA